MKTKTKILFAILLLVIIGSLMACEDCLDNPAVITKKTVEVSYGPNGIGTPKGLFEVEEGKVLVINTEPFIGFKTWNANVNDVDYALYTNKYDTIVKNNLKINITFKENLSWFIAPGVDKTWVMDSVYIYERVNVDDLTSPDIWKYHKSTAEETVIFSSNGKFKIYLKKVFAGEGSWSIEDRKIPPILNWGGLWKIEVLTDKKMTLYKDNFKYLYSHH